MTTYEVAVTREGKWWMVSIPELGGLTQARRLAEVDTMAREWIAVTTGAELDDVAVLVHMPVVDGIDVDAALKEIIPVREEAATLEKRYLEQAEKLAKDLSAADVPLRDIGHMLGVTFQRAHQLVNA